MTEIPCELINGLRAAGTQVAKYLAIERKLRTAIEDLLGDEELATVDGEPVVRWAHIKTRRLDNAKLRENVDPAVYAGCYVDSVQRRFIMLGGKHDDD